ncbi:DUF3626 domain-containing protein [Amycolatopsis eburnea]|uniref:DUF3626 domain-containing protein n=1 Tax=Amycolatopsis eburnea TaxID=2267691 RepID=A0A427SVX5_9PSEU|nr:DUF3626 domain-containing protein [Amycolatopsis eburnea]RSD08110.1 DUF3626 domain-containing protein [Amycolatopsis eburnea]
MVRGSGKPRWQAAVDHVANRVAGPPLPDDLDVTVHFHPDRLVDGVPLLRHLLADGVYRSQFETGTGNGGLTAHPGGDRWRWEHRIFGGVYDALPPSDRPKYGSLNHRRRPAGGSVRFGSAHLRLKREVLTRVTFCYPDSFHEPSDFGTAAHLPLLPLVEAAAPDELDDYVEAHVHGPLRIPSDVAALVLDPAFRGTDVEAAAVESGLPTHWHHGFRLSVAALAEHADYRGEDVVRAGADIAEDGWLDARVIGEAVRAGRHDPQVLKRLWHCTARFGLRDAGG